jgi:hypothetical protein
MVVGEQLQWWERDGWEHGVSTLWNRPWVENP